MMTENVTVFDKVFDAQKSFTAIMNAFTFPGRIARLDMKRFVLDVEDRYAFAASILTALCGPESLLGFSSDIGREQSDTLLKISGAQRSAAKEAHFYLFDGAAYDAGVCEIGRGTLEYPEKSTTAIILVNALSDAGTRADTDSYEVRGPGVNGTLQFHVSGLNREYIRIREELNDVYPMGVDYLLCAGDGALCGLPRTSSCTLCKGR